MLRCGLAFADVILAATYISDGYYWYALITVCLVVLPTGLVQVFSVRWHYMDEVMNKGILILHTCLLGVLYRYYDNKMWSLSRKLNHNFWIY